MSTAAEIGTVLRRVKTELGTERDTDMAGGLITVKFAVPVPTYVPLEALASARYVAGGVPSGPVLVIVKVADFPGPRLTELAEKLVGQPAGWLELIAKLVAEQPEESLLVIERLYAAALPG